MASRHGSKKKKTLGQLRDAGDVWECPGCGRDNIHSINYIEQVIDSRGHAVLLDKAGVKAIEDLPMASGSAFETRCGACRNSFAPREIDGRPNPILHPAYTHSED